MTTLAQQIKQLREQLAAAIEREKTVREHWFPFPGHATPELCGIAARTIDGERWGIFEDSQFAPAVFVGDRWVAPWSTSMDTIYRYGRDEALELAPGLAQASAKAYALAAEVVEENTPEPVEAVA